MAHSLAARLHDFAVLPVRPGALRRGLIAGSAWGIVMGAILTALATRECGGLCLADAALSTALATGAGLCTIGPLAAFGARA
jgi:hypothetical protein